MLCEEFLVVFGDFLYFFCVFSKKPQKSLKKRVDVGKKVRYNGESLSKSIFSTSTEGKGSEEIF